MRKDLLRWFLTGIAGSIIMTLAGYVLGQTPASSVTMVLSSYLLFALSAIMFRYRRILWRGKEEDRTIPSREMRCPSSRDLKVRRAGVSFTPALH